MEQRPLPLRLALRAIGDCALETAVLLADRRIHQPRDHVGSSCRWADGTTSLVYRETVLDRPPTVAPTVLIVGFRLRHVHHAALHALFRAESELNTPLFVGFPGFVSKLWCAHDERGLYRGLYEWDDPASAEQYVRALWWALRAVSVPSSIRSTILPGLHRDELLDDPRIGDRTAPDEPGVWWRLTETMAAPTHDRVGAAA